MTMLSFVFACFYFYALMFSSGGEELTVPVGKRVMLPCLLPEAASILMMKMVKRGVQGPGYLSFYRGGRFRESFHHPSFKNRVKFKDPRMENGNVSVFLSDVSLFLSNVSLNDSGTYECAVGYRTTGSNVTGTFKHLNNLTVTDAPVNRGHAGLVPPSVLLSVPPSVPPSVLQSVLQSFLLPLLLLVPVMTLVTCFILRLAQTR